MVDKLIKRKEAAEMLGISLDTLDHARMEGVRPDRALCSVA